MMFLKILYWDLINKRTRNEYLYELARNFPGRAGFFLRNYFLQNRFMSAGDNLKIHKGCRIINIENMSVGNNVHFGVDAYFQAGGGIEVGDYSELGPGSKIWSQNHIYDQPDTVLEGAGYEYAPVSIGANVWLGANVFIMPGVTLPDGCVVSAGSVVGVKKWLPNSIISGNPARRIGERGVLRKQNKS